MMRRFISIYWMISVVSSALLVGLPFQSVGEQKDQTIDDIIVFVQEATLEEFLQAIEAHHWKMPVIYSRWHIEHIATEEKRSEMIQARAFGKALLDRLSEWRALMRADVSPDQLQQHIEQFFELADWLMASKGYGNLFLAVRCHDIATMGIGRLLVNLDYPLEKTHQLVSTLEAPWYAPSVRQYVLNREVGVELFVSESNEEADIQRVLEETWQIGILSWSRQKRARQKASTGGELSEEQMDEAKQFLENQIQQIIQRGSPLLRENLAFFEDDELPYPRIITTASMWDRKWHRKFIAGFRLRNTAELQALAIFREAVGFFPTEPQFSEEELKQREARIQAARKKGIIIVPFEEAFNSLGEAAFNQAWTPHATKETQNLDALAWDAYEEITAGTFIDEDSRAEMMGKR